MAPDGMNQLFAALQSQYGPITSYILSSSSSFPANSDPLWYQLSTLRPLLLDAVKEAAILVNGEAIFNAKGFEGDHGLKGALKLKFAEMNLASLSNAIHVKRFGEKLGTNLFQFDSKDDMLGQVDLFERIMANLGFVGKVSTGTPAPGSIGEFKRQAVALLESAAKSLHLGILKSIGLQFRAQRNLFGLRVAVALRDCYWK